MQRHSGQLAATERQHKQTRCGTDENLCKATSVYNKYPSSTLHQTKLNATNHEVYGSGVTTQLCNRASANKKWENVEDNISVTSWAASEPAQWA